MTNDTPYFCPRCGHEMSARDHLTFCHNPECVRSGHGVWSIESGDLRLHRLPLFFDEYRHSEPQVQPWKLTILLLLILLGVLIYAFRHYPW